ncbi:DgyrCDS12894 [Dimorphilus gyrociliatus]|uniref:DgyrCDS12894 n=1 Tax=Dimorphilus gyrociliatus TaxID=2664684 RepID=A0A7I8W922_9ANNE|nr:DgyrCDS12894 [Dimorphilus gyrociliatus]
MLKTLLVCLFVGQIVASPYHRSKRATCTTNTDCSGYGTCNGGSCTCDMGYTGDKCENQCFPADIVFVLDESGSVTEPNWIKQLEFTNELVDMFPIASDKVRIGYVTYSSKVNKVRHLKDTPTKAEIKQIISQLSYAKGGTNTPAAVFSAATTSFSKGNGDRIETPAVPNIMIIMTDGKTSSQYKPDFDLNAALLRSKKDIEVFAIGISAGVDEQEIEALASLPVDEHKFIVNDFSALNTIKQKILNAICKSTAAKASPCDKNPCHDPGTTKCVNGGNGAYTCECKVGYVGKHCETRCGVADIAWIIDSSGSIGKDNYVKQMKFIRDFCDKLDISPTASQVAAVSFGLTARLDFDFKQHQDKASLLTAIDGISYMQSYTNTSGGIRRAIEKVFTPAGGDRLDKPNIAIVITDGESNKDKDDTIPAAKLLHKHTTLGVSTFCVAVGSGVKQSEVKGIASDPDSEFVIEIKNYNEINQHLTKILEGTCKTSDADHCLSGPCQNGGSCTKISNGYKCTCKAGWTGNNCQTNIDDCKPNPCLNGGVCVDGVNSYTCNCVNGWSGPTCDIPKDFCKPTNPCVHGTCSSQASGYTCTCNQGYQGTNCDVLIDHCKPTNPCVHGTCASSVSGFTCTCNQGYQGTKCDVLIDNCKPTNPCQNGGACTSTISGYTCACVNGYTGNQCQTAPANDCGKVDICFVIDSSASIGSNWGKQLDFIADFSKKFTIGDKARIGAVTYSSTAEISFPIDGAGSASTNAEFETKVKAITHMRKGTYTHEGLGLAPDCGWRTAAGIKKLAIVVTDGKSIKPTETATIANSVRSNYNIEIHAVGIANADAAELEAIAGIGKTNAGKVYTAPDFDSLGNVANELAQGTCGTGGGTPNQGCAKADILFVVDSSASVSLTNWGLQVQFIIDLVKDFTIGDDKTKFGMVTFSSAAEISFPVSGASSPQSQQDFETKIKAVTHMRKGTNTDVGLDLVNTAGITWRPADPSIRRMVIVITDGQSKYPDKTKISADALRQAGIEVHAVGIKNYVKAELDAISGLGQAKAGSTFTAPDFTDLTSIISKIKSGVCTVQDPCSPNPCMNSGACSSNGNTFTCTCTGGYTGATCATPPNPCSFTPCKNGGQCTSSGNSFTCTCVNSYHGATCQNAPGCNSNPCQNGGQCTNGVNGAYSCACINGYTGNNCQTPPANPCSPNPCQNGGQCAANGNGHTCTCVNSYWGTNCGNAPGCNSNPCQNGGQCTNGVNGAYSCACINGYTGNNCQTPPANPCSPNPCQNGGQCTANGNGHTCTCVNSYWGTNCGNAPGCNSNPCQNGGQCTNGVNGAYSCACINGFTGNNCQTPPNPCAPNPCQNGGQCAANGNSHTCTCVNSYWGTNCGNAPGCNSNPCQNGGQCTNGVNGAYSCACINGFTGNNCQTPPNPCAPNPCQNGGQCTANGNSHTCTCVNSFWGTNCGNAPGCNSNPCQNGGQCTNGVNGAYSCTCTSGFTGNNCQTASRNEQGCGVCSGAGCVTGAMDADAVYGTNGGSIKDCPACYTKKNKDGSFQRGCVSDIPAEWTTALQVSTSDIPDAGGSVCYPMNEAGGSEVCLCKGNNCNMQSFNDVGGGHNYFEEEITCKCASCPSNPSADNPFKCYKDGFIPKCDCQNCDCLNAKRRKRWASWLW